MSNFSEQAVFQEQLPKIGRGIGLRGIEQKLNKILEPLVNRTRFLKENGTGGGFNYGGELDATPTISTQTADFDVIDNGSIVDNVFTPSSPVGSAIATNISTNFGVPQYIEFLWPDIGGSDTFMLGFFTPDNIVDIQSLFTDPNSGFIAIGYFGGVLSFSKYGDNPPEMLPIENPVSVGDQIRVELNISTGLVNFTNLTTNTGLCSFDLGNYIEFYNSLALFIYATVAISFDIAGTSNPLTQTLYGINIPEDAVGKTYLVTTATEESFINNKLVKEGDFVTFFQNNTVIDCVVTRLLSDAEINAISQQAAQAAITQELEVGGSIYEFVMSLIN